MYIKNRADFIHAFEMYSAKIVAKTQAILENSFLFRIYGIIYSKRICSFDGPEYISLFASNIKPEVRSLPFMVRCFRG